MLLRYFYDRALAHASYLVGCQRTGEAVIVDPGRDVDQYLKAAKSEGVKITGVAETHIHADYVSGARELADQTGTKLYVSDEGPEDWKYLYASQYDHQLLKDGDVFMVGNIRFEVVYTPGHTPESISFVISDQGGNADKPMGIFTGDFVFVGSIGRPDLLEEAAGFVGTAEPGARDLFKSIERFKALPDYLQVWPAHGAGSACGKGLGAIPSSTVGYEKRFNPALQYSDEDEFVQYILSEQPEAPKYFAVMKRVNKEGPAIIGDNKIPEHLSVADLTAQTANATLIDLTSPAQFAELHVPGSINIPAGMLAGWAGWVVDYSIPVYLIAKPDDLPEAMRILRKIGLDDIRGYFDSDEVRQSGLARESYRQAKPTELLDPIREGKFNLIDVRSAEEWKECRISEANHHFLGRLQEHLGELDKAKPVVAQCRTGGRSAIAASLLQAAGFEVINMTGGFLEWDSLELPTDCRSATVTLA